MKSRKLWLTSVLAWYSEQQKQQPMPDTEKLLSSQYQYYKFVFGKTLADNF